MTRAQLAQGVQSKTGGREDDAKTKRCSVKNAEKQCEEASNTSGHAASRKHGESILKLIVQPRDGIEPLLSAIEKAKKSIDILIFRLDWKELENALKAASGRGLAVRALIAHTNRGGESKLRALEMRFLEAGITVGRTADDLVRYHGKMMIIDRRTLLLLSFNFVHLDIEHSRGFGLIVTNPRIVQEATRLFDADLNRKAYTGGLKSFIVSPVNARTELSAFIKKARKQLWIYDPKIADKQILKLLEERAKAGLDIKIIGSLGIRGSHLWVTPLTSMRLHTRTIIRDGRQAFVGSQSLRQLELDSRREIGIVVSDRKIVKALLATFESDWGATGFEETRETIKANTEQDLQPTAEATEALAKVLPPLKTTIKKVIKRAVAKAGKETLAHGDLKSTVKKTLKTAVKEAVAEIAFESAEK